MGFRSIETADLTNWQQQPDQLAKLFASIRRVLEEEEPPEEVDIEAPPANVDAEVDEKAEKGQAITYRGAAWKMWTAVLVVFMGAAVYLPTYFDQDHDPIRPIITPVDSSDITSNSTNTDSLAPVFPAPPLTDPIPAANIPEDLSFISEGLYEDTDRNIRYRLVPAGPSTKPFLLSEHEITVGQYKQFEEATRHFTTANGVDGTNWKNPGFSQDDQHAVVNVSWHDAVAFAKWAGASLPTEAEWEHAAKAGTENKWAGTDDLKSLCQFANILDSSTIYFDAEACDDGYARTSPVGHFSSNKFGLYDMTGNASEWVKDESESSRFFRGGSWYDDRSDASIMHRDSRGANYRANHIGFRLMRALE